MTQEDKELLLKYLCMALPYKVVIEYNNDGYSSTRELGLGSLHDFIVDNAECKPYLRPMSSMTEEEKKEYNSHLSGIITGIDAANFMIWVYKHHLDIFHFVEKGLALEALEGMYK